MYQYTIVSAMENTASVYVLYVWIYGRRVQSDIYSGFIYPYLCKWGGAGWATGPC